MMTAVHAQTLADCRALAEKAGLLVRFDAAGVLVLASPEEPPENPPPAPAAAP